MASLYIILVLVTALEPGLTFVLESESQTLKWPTQYHLRGEETNILTGIIKPWEIWYSDEVNKSRIDYYDGAVKHYYIGENDKDYGKKYSIFPMTTEDVTNEIVCKESKLEGKQLDFLPATKDFEFIEKIIYNGKLVDVWQYLKTEEGESKLEKTLYVYKNEGFDIPVLREIKNHDLWLGTVDAHSVTRFFDYSKPELDALDSTKEKSCEDPLSTAYNFGDNLDDLPLHISSDVEEAFHRYIIHHNKKYEGDEHAIRRKIFEENWRRVVHHNQQNLGYKLTINKFSDRTEEELAHLTATRSSSSHVGSVPFPHTEEEVAQLALELPDEYDMRTEGFISSVKNQANCGSCWAFSTTAAVEGALARNNGGRELDLAEQSMVDCAWGFGNMGCEGGMIEDAFKYILKHGIPTQMEYGVYLDEVGFCKLDNMTETYKIKGFAAVPPLSINAMKLALYKYGPVTVAINANEGVKAYKNGIFYDPTCNDSPFNHGVTVVGYGVRDGVTYWIVKNSWGEDWGMDGYILFSANNNNCHVLEGAYYPIA